MSLRQFRYHIPEEDRPRLKKRLLSHRKISKGCWIWTAYVQKNGYGWSNINHKISVSSHRLSYLVYIGDIPEGYCIHHICRVKACFNPKHLQAVTVKEHLKLDEHPAYLASQKTHCIRGHEFNEENTFWKKGRRICRACRRVYNNEIYARRYSAGVNGACRTTLVKRGLM